MEDTIAKIRAEILKLRAQIRFLEGALEGIRLATEKEKSDVERS